MVDAARELKRLMPTVPLMMYSAFGDRFVEQQARLVGISELVSKSQPAAILVSRARSLVYRNVACIPDVHPVQVDIVGL
jgi:DNA-binding NarL/FixJ family response regulator